MPASTPDSASSRASALTGAWLWFCCFQFFVAEQIARLRWRGQYSMLRNYISDLGMLRCDRMGCSPLHWLMNGSFVLQGVLIFLGALLLRPLLSRALWGWFAVAGAGVFLVGLVPEGTAFPLHLVGAAANFLAGNVGLIFLGWITIRRQESPRGFITLSAGMVGILATMAIAMSLGPRPLAPEWSAGLIERLAAYPLPLCLTWTGVSLLGRLRE